MDLTQIPSTQKVLLIPLVIDAFYSSSDTTWKYDYIDLGRVAKMAPNFEILRVHWLGTDFSANFQGKVVMSWSVSGRLWSADVDLLPAQTADGQVIGSDYNNPANFGLNVRVAIAVSNVTGSATESGRITAILEIRLRS